MPDGLAGRVCVAVRPDLAPIVRDEILRARPGATVVGADACARADVLLVAPHELTPEEVGRLVAMQPWRWIHLTSAGFDFFDTSAVAPETVLTRSATCYAPPLTEYVAAALLADARPGPLPWQAGGAYVPSPDVGVYGQTLGVAGLGAIGRNVVTLGTTLGMRVVVLTRRPRGPGELPPGVEGVTRAADLAGVDHLVLALPLTGETHHILDDAFFRRCEPGLHLVNVARGPLVDHDALARAVAERGVRATLDVTEPEPLPAGHPLRRAPGVRISDHVAWHSRTSDWSFVGDFLANWSRWEERAPLRGLVEVRETGKVA